MDPKELDSRLNTMWKSFVDGVAYISKTKIRATYNGIDGVLVKGKDLAPVLYLEDWRLNLVPCTKGSLNRFKSHEIKEAVKKELASSNPGVIFMAGVVESKYDGSRGSVWRVHNDRFPAVYVLPVASYRSGMPFDGDAILELFNVLGDTPNPQSYPEFKKQPVQESKMASYVCALDRLAIMG